MKSKRPMKLLGAWLFVLRQKLRSLKVKEQIVITEIPYEINKTTWSRKSMKSVSTVGGRCSLRFVMNLTVMMLRIAIEQKDANTDLFSTTFSNTLTCKSTQPSTWWRLTISPLVRLGLCQSCPIISPTVVKSFGAFSL